jgi:hypothetical protein
MQTRSAVMRSGFLGHFLRILGDFWACLGIKWGCQGGMTGHASMKSPSDFFIKTKGHL